VYSGKETKYLNVDGYEQNQNKGVYRCLKLRTRVNRCKSMIKLRTRVYMDVIKLRTMV
jgi:hypothetical protein